MNYTELALRFFVGGGLIVMVALISRTKCSILSGIFILFPAVSLIGFYYIGSSVGAEQLRQITKFSIYSLPTIFVFLFTFYNTHQSIGVNKSLFVSLVAWLISAGMLLILTR